MAVLCGCGAVIIAAVLLGIHREQVRASTSAVGAAPLAPFATASWTSYLPVPVVLAVACLLVCSAFFSSSEIAFFSIPRQRLRTLRQGKSFTGRLVSNLMQHPGRLLTTILVGNMIVNTLTGVLLGTRVENLFEHSLKFPAPAAYGGAIAVCTGVLLFFGEISPKVFAVRVAEPLARFAAVPLVVVGKLLAPIRDGMLRLTDLLFRITRFHEVRAAPFITDEELKSVLTDEDAGKRIEKEERQMIRGILEFHDVQVRDILVPRPDVIALPEDATPRHALDLFREQEYARMPIYKDDLDHITGVLVAKDLLPNALKGQLDQPVKSLARPPHFVPETMTVSAFVKEAQRLHTHLAIVVDEYGGTEGIVTLQDAIEQVVGDIMDETDEEESLFERLADGVYRVEGSLPLEKLGEFFGVAIEDEEHATVSGFLMNQTDKILEAGDRIDHSGLRFTVEAVEGKRASSIRIEQLQRHEEDAK